MGPLTSERLARLLYPQTLAFVGGLTIVLIIVSALVRLRATLMFDVKVTRWLQVLSTPFLDWAMKWLTVLGNGPALVLTPLILAGIAYSMDLGETMVYILGSLVSLPINVVLKNTFDRKRPGEDEVKVYPGPRWGFSYPSGHAMGSTAVYGFLAVLVWLHVTDPVLRVALLTPFVLLPPLISISRIYLGAHWLSDVVGGMAGGMIVVIALAALYSP